MGTFSEKTSNAPETLLFSPHYSFLDIFYIHDTPNQILVALVDHNLFAILHR